MGWLTVAAYALTAILCFSAARTPGRPAVRWFWLALAILLFGLMINKQLDLQSALTATARCLSQMQGWYEDRHIVQRRFILAVLAAGALVALVSLWLLRRHIRQIGLALLGFVFLICFVLIRAAGFHDFDALLRSDILSVRMNWLMELSGIALIAMNAAWAMKRNQLRGME